MNRLVILLLICLALSLAQEIGARYLIITHDSYYDVLQPLVEWKRRKGLRTKIVKLSEIGSDSTQIRNYVVNAYNTWSIRPEYLLLVGNKYQIPFPRILYNPPVICYSDNYYTNVIGDFHNEILPGRFWVYDTVEAKTVVAKVLGYEKDPSIQDPSWFKKGVTIVREDTDSFPSDSVYWADARFAHDLMNEAGFVHIDSLAKSFGHDSFAVINAINSGRSYILYRGISGRRWAHPFKDIYPSEMNNAFKLPIVLSATCRTVEDLGYEWLTAGIPEEPKGVVGFLGTSTALMHAAEMRSALAKGTLKSIFNDSLSTLGRAAESGRLKYYELFGNTLEYDSWTCLGDPEMRLWTTTPKQLEVTHNTTLQIGVCTVFVNVQHGSIPVANASVCVIAKKDTTVYHCRETDSLGGVVFIDTFHVLGDSVLITVTGYHLKPYCGLAKVPFYGPYVILNSFSILDTIDGNGDYVANPGENIGIPVCVMNWGDSTAYGVSGMIQKTIPDSFFALNDTEKYFGEIQPLDSVFTSDDGYNVIVAPNCPDSHAIGLQLVVSDTHATTWISDLSFTVHAPILLYNDYYFPGFVKSTPIGDTNQLIIILENAGSCNAENTFGRIFSVDSFLVVIDSTSSFGTIYSNSLGSNQFAPFVIATLPETPPGYPQDIKFVVTAGVYVDTFNVTIYVGQKDYFVWDKDPNYSSGPIIKALLDSLDFYGDYNAIEMPYDYLSLYKSIFVCCGMYPDNYIIKDTSRAGPEIEEYIQIFGGRVYLEGGDVWYADPHNYHGYHFHPVFCINPISTGVGPFPNVLGVDSAFTQTMNFSYSGECNSIDRIDPDSNGVLIFKSAFNDASCGVAAQNRTVGLSFELGCLVDSTEPSTKLALIDSIMQYFDIRPTGVKECTPITDVKKFMFEILPNPSRGKVYISCCAGNAIQAELRIYDATGRLIKQFNDLADHQSPFNQIVWDARDETGREVPVGVYFVQFETPEYKKAKKVILLK